MQYIYTFAFISRTFLGHDQRSRATVSTVHKIYPFERFSSGVRVAGLKYGLRSKCVCIKKTKRKEHLFPWRSIKYVIVCFALVQRVAHMTPKGSQTRTDFSCDVKWTLKRPNTQTHSNFTLSCRPPEPGVERTFITKKSEEFSVLF